MLELNRWWLGRPDERYWLEVTDRVDPGVNLKAPQRNETGGEFWSYALVREVQPGDLIFHYDRPSQIVMGVSRATGDLWDDQIVWGARGTYAREAGVVPHSRAGWYAGLTSFEKLDMPLTLESVRQREAEVRRGLEELQELVDGPLYYPFERGGKRPIRPIQGYLFRLPEFFVSMFSELRQGAADHGRRKMRALVVREDVGAEYRRADEELAIGAFDPMQVDPAVVERGTRGHAITQNAVADYLASKGVSPRSPASHEPSFDLAWEHAGTLFVAEVKSVTNLNEERQLRMGLGQVLQYRFQMGQGLKRKVVGVIVSERRPPKQWISLCESLGVIVAWPGEMERIGI